MDHQYIDTNAVADRYLGNKLAREDREAFERHLVDCQECADRLLLAGMFHAQVRNSASDGNGAHAKPHAPRRELNYIGAIKPPRVIDIRVGPPPALFVRLKPLQILWILLISVFLLVAIPALGWWIFEGYSGK